MKPPTNELIWWIDLNGSTNIAQSDRAIPKRPTLACGKVYLDSKSGVIVSINSQPARTELVSRQLLDVLHARFPGTRWWIRDPAAVSQQHSSAAS